MPASNNSRIAYGDHVVDGKATTQRERVLLFLQRSNLPLTRYQISIATGIRLLSICGRVDALMDGGLVEVAYTDVDGHTGRRADYLRAVERAPKQGVLL